MLRPIPPGEGAYARFDRCFERCALHEPGLQRGHEMIELRIGAIEDLDALEQEREPECVR
jgi:hypothetical protein